MDDEQEGIATVEEGRIKGIYFVGSSTMHYDCDRQTKSNIVCSTRSIPEIIYSQSAIITLHRVYIYVCTRFIVVIGVLIACVQAHMQSL